MAEHVLVFEGLLTAAELERALSERSGHGDTLNQVLLRLGMVDEILLAQCLARSLAIPLISAADMVSIPPEVISRVPAKAAIKNRAVPVRIFDDTLLVAMGDPSDEQAVAEVTFVAEMYIQRAVTLESLIDDALNSYYGYSGSSTLPLGRDNEFEQPVKTLKMDRSEVAQAIGATLPPLREKRDTDEERALMRGARPTDEQRLPPMPIEGAATIRMPSIRRDTEETPRADGTIDPLSDRHETDRHAEAGADWPTLPFGATSSDADLEHRPTSLYRAVARPKRDDSTDEVETVVPAPVSPAERAESVLDDWRKTEEVRRASAKRKPRRKRSTLPIPTVAPTERRRSADTVEEAAAAAPLDESPPPPSALAPVEARSVGALEGELDSIIEQLGAATTIDQMNEIALGFMGLLCEQRGLISVEEGGLCGQAAAGGGLSPTAFKSLWIPMERSSVFGAVVQSQIPYQGPLLFGKEERTFASHVGKHPERILLVPIVVDDEVTGLLYGDGLTANIPLPLVRRLAAALGKATARVKK